MNASLYFKLCDTYACVYVHSSTKPIFNFSIEMVLINYTKLWILSTILCNWHQLGWVYWGSAAYCKLCNTTINDWNGLMLVWWCYLEWWIQHPVGTVTTYGRCWKRRKKHLSLYLLLKYMFGQPGFGHVWAARIWTCSVRLVASLLKNCGTQGVVAKHNPEAAKEFIRCMHSLHSWGCKITPHTEWNLNVHTYVHDPSYCLCSVFSTAWLYSQLHTLYRWFDSSSQSVWITWLGQPP